MFWDILKILIYIKVSNFAELSSLSVPRKVFEMDRNSTNERRSNLSRGTVMKRLGIYSAGGVKSVAEVSSIRTVKVSLILQLSPMA